MDDRYEEEYRLYWKVCLNAVEAPVDEVQLLHDPESLEREMAKDPDAASDPVWHYNKMNERRSFLPVADHHDMLRLRGEDRYIRMHPRRWLWTMDALLTEYMYIVKHSTQAQLIQLPREIINARANYLKRRKAERKELRISIGGIKVLGKGYYLKGKCMIPKYTGNAKLNLWCRDLCTHGGATSVKADIRYDGEKFKLGIDEKKDDSSNEAENAKNSEQKTDDFIPAFTLSDYIFHELATGLSLSIEITAALMELPPEIRDFALETFLKKGLFRVAESKYIYTRIAVARSFFHQLNLEWLKYTYSWDSINEILTEEETKHPISPGKWEKFEDSMDFACFHLGFLELGRNTIHLIDSDVETYPEDRVWVEHERDREMMYQATIKREERRDTAVPWIEVHDPETVDLYIRTRPFSFRHISVPADGVELDKMIQQYEGLIGMVEYPLNLSRWKTIPPKNLAVFVQRKHTYVPVLLDYLKYGNMKKWHTETEFKERGETPVIFKDSRAVCIEYYVKVHSRVQEACIAAINA